MMFLRTICMSLLFACGALSVYADTCVIDTQKSLYEDIKDDAVWAAGKVKEFAVDGYHVITDEVCQDAKIVKQELGVGVRFAARWAVPTICIAGVVYLACVKPLGQMIDKLPAVVDQCGDKFEKIVASAGKEAATHLLSDAAKNIELAKVVEKLDLPNASKEAAKHLLSDAAKNLDLPKAAEVVGKEAATHLLSDAAKNIELAKTTESLCKESIGKFKPNVDVVTDHATNHGWKYAVGAGATYIAGHTIQVLLKK